MDSSLNTLLTAVLLLIPGSVVIRVIICCIQIAADSEQESLYKRQAKNAVLFAIIAESALALLTLCYNYFT